ncbi:MAG: vitamin B12-dependent ribonucleotide reductase [Planctomycetes bacterium]|nr:vitamin B12-dependent ribonucleotide reductase [Planctomycetota bacterium]
MQIREGVSTKKSGDRTTSRRTGGKTAKGTAGKGLRIPRVFTTEGVHPYDAIAWEKRTASITNDQGKVIFEQKDVEVPATWSMTATNVVVSKYFKGAVDKPGRESSVRQLVDRVAKTAARWGSQGGYFASSDDSAIFEAELTHLLVNQMASFNSPVWFNLGVEAHPQCSACFINSVEDSMEGIMALARTEAMLFKHGSGTGTNLSPIRSSRERLSSGGWASGPVSFMKGYDAFASVIKSGGKTRRAAKMVMLNIDHPDVVEFIECKANEEKKAWALIDAGYDGSFNGEAYSSIFFQNSNNSVRVTDEFMNAVVEDKEWHTRAITTGEVMATFRARDLMKRIVEAAWVCGDPGLQFDSTLNDWHTCATTGRINASNPCAEYVFLDDTACNLSSLNLMLFRRPDGEFDVERFRRAVDVMILAQEILVDNASYPTPKIERNSHDYRPLGLGYANLGALLMARGLPYDSDEARATSAAITALMTGEAYRYSAVVASEMGAFPGYAKNEAPMLRVIGKHRDAVSHVDATKAQPDLIAAAQVAWDEALALGRKHGYKNAQVTVIAPTGTIGFMMDCDTTGIEPDLALVKYKKLVGGGFLKIVNRTVPEALRRLGYSDEQATAIVAHVDENETIEGAPGLADEHLDVFDCALTPVNGVRSIHYMGHIRMMGAVQPFLSGSISKTCNLPQDVTPEDIEKTYVEAWRLGLKCIAIYRDGCKRTQPLNTGRTKSDASIKTSDVVAIEKPAAPPPVPRPVRRRLPDERHAITHKFSIGGHDGYLTVGLYEDNTPGEIFIVMAKEGSAVSGLVDSVATSISLALQYGVPLEVMVNKFSHTRFEPTGFTNNRQIPIAKSIMDYVFRWLGIKFLHREGALGGNEATISTSVPLKEYTPPTVAEPSAPEDASGLSHPRTTNGHASSRIPTTSVPRLSGGSGAATTEAPRFEIDAPPCSECGAIMVPNGSCYRCLNCGSTSGCS